MPMSSSVEKRVFLICNCKRARSPPEVPWVVTETTQLCFSNAFSGLICPANLSFERSFFSDGVQVPMGLEKYSRMR